jgi:hypothetical protein
VISQNVVPANACQEELDGRRATPDAFPKQDLTSGKANRNRPRDFLKNLSIESFGVNGSPTGPGYDSPGKFSTSVPFTSHDFECPRCITRPSMERMRYTLPAFGSVLTLKMMNGRAELFTGIGGINAWKPDNTTIEPRRDRSFNDAWLVQGVAGARIAVDKDRHFWLGGATRYVRNYGAGRTHWNSLGGSATFQFGK